MTNAKMVMKMVLSEKGIMQQITKMDSRVTKELLEDVVVMTGGMESYFGLTLKSNRYNASEKVQKMNDKIQFWKSLTNDFYIEIQRHGGNFENELNSVIVPLSVNLLNSPDIGTSLPAASVCHSMLAGEITCAGVVLLVVLIAIEAGLGIIIYQPHSGQASRKWRIKSVDINPIDDFNR